MYEVVTSRNLTLPSIVKVHMHERRFEGSSRPTSGSSLYQWLEIPVTAKSLPAEPAHLVVNDANFIGYE